MYIKCKLAITKRAPDMARSYPPEKIVVFKVDRLIFFCAILRGSTPPNPSVLLIYKGAPQKKYALSDFLAE